MGILGGRWVVCLKDVLTLHSLRSFLKQGGLARHTGQFAFAIYRHRRIDTARDNLLCQTKSWVTFYMTLASVRPLEDPKAGAAQVADILRDRIVKGEIETGERLVERHLSAELNVSRTPIREALKLLEADGLIEISMHRGAIVSDYRAEDGCAL